MHPPACCLAIFIFGGRTFGCCIALLLGALSTQTSMSLPGFFREAMCALHMWHVSAWLRHMADCVALIGESAGSDLHQPDNFCQMGTYVAVNGTMYSAF